MCNRSPILDFDSIETIVNYKSSKDKRYKHSRDKRYKH
jgi:hypothetical protein